MCALCALSSRSTYTGVSNSIENFSCVSRYACVGVKQFYQHILGANQIVCMHMYARLANIIRWLNATHFIIDFHTCVWCVKSWYKLALVSTTSISIWLRFLNHGSGHNTAGHNIAAVVGDIIVAGMIFLDIEPQLFYSAHLIVCAF